MLPTLNLLTMHGLKRFTAGSKVLSKPANHSYSSLRFNSILLFWTSETSYYQAGQVKFDSTNVLFKWRELKNYNPDLEEMFLV